MAGYNFLYRLGDENPLHIEQLLLQGNLQKQILKERNRENDLEGIFKDTYLGDLWRRPYLTSAFNLLLSLVSSTSSTSGGNGGNIGKRGSRSNFSTEEEANLGDTQEMFTGLSRDMYSPFFAREIPDVKYGSMLHPWWARRGSIPLGGRVRVLRHSNPSVDSATFDAYGIVTSLPQPGRADLKNPELRAENLLYKVAVRHQKGPYQNEVKQHYFQRDELILIPQRHRGSTENQVLIPRLLKDEEKSTNVPFLSIDGHFVFHFPPGEKQSGYYQFVNHTTSYTGIDIDGY